MRDGQRVATLRKLHLQRGERGCLVSQYFRVLSQDPVTRRFTSWIHARWRIRASCPATCVGWFVARSHFFAWLSQPPGRGLGAIGGRDVVSAEASTGGGRRAHGKDAGGTGDAVETGRIAPLKTAEPSWFQALHRTEASCLMAALGTAWPLACTS